MTIPINEIDDDYSDFLFKFANTFTEESILTGYINDHKNDDNTNKELLAELGYSDKDILDMDL